MMGDIAIRISDIHVTFGDHKVLKGASGLIRKGSIVTFLGRNGCGKSTLLKAVTGNLKPDKGSVEIAGKPLGAYKADELSRVVAFLPQFLPANGATLRQMAELGAGFSAMTFLTFVLYAWVAASGRSLILGRPAVMAWMRRAFAASFAALGLRLALERA